MTSDAAPIDLPADDDGRLFCYRHPDRETWVRCGRCDQPICTKCAMQGPVGFRCKQCGKLKNDPLTSFTPVQLVLGVTVAVVAGAVAAIIADRIGFLSIIVSFFAGGLIVEAVTRVTGYKRGPVMLAVVFGGIVVGSLIGFGINYGLMLADFQAAMDAAGAASEDVPIPMGSLIGETLIWALIGAGAACAGAWGRLRL